MTSSLAQTKKALIEQRDEGSPIRVVELNRIMPAREESERNHPAVFMLTTLLILQPAEGD
jgi:hypothetical protein